MKKTLSLLACLGLLLSLASCAQQSSAVPEVPFAYYYRTAEVGYSGEDGVIRSELRDVAGHEGDLHWIIRDYLKGPQSPDLISPFPKETEALTCKIEDGTLFLQVDKSFANMTGIELSLAASCIAATCFGLEEVEAVSIYVSTGLLDGKPSIRISRDTLLLRDSGADRMNTEMDLYYVDKSGRYLIPESRTVSLANQSNPQEYLLRRLAEQPSSSELEAVLPEGTRVLEVTTEDGICNVDLSAEFVNNKPEDPTACYMCLLAIANTVTQTADADKVELYVDGSLLTHYGIWPLNAPLQRDESHIGPVRTGLNEYDTDICLPLDGAEGLVRVPVRIRQSANETEAEQLCRTLVSYPAVNCVVNPFPTETKILGVRESGGLWIVDVSQELLRAADLALCIRTLTATLGLVDGVDSVLVTVDGERPAGFSEELFSVQFPDPALIIS